MGQSSAEWYHGSPLHLTVLQAGSTITRDLNLARIFSHKPEIVSIDEDGDRLILRHNGIQPGWLYRVLDVREEDVYPHPTSTMADGLEWLTRRDLVLERIECTEVRSEEFLTPEDIHALKERMENKG